MQDKLVVYYLRHGENEANLEGVFTSRKLDHNLTSKGVEQSHQVAEFLATQHPNPARGPGVHEETRGQFGMLKVTAEWPLGVQGEWQCRYDR